MTTEMVAEVSEQNVPPPPPPSTTTATATTTKTIANETSDADV
jgi:hypothetical protein